MVSKSKKSDKSEKAKKVKKIKDVSRISSGIPGFDKIIGGGFIRNSSNLIVGSSGSGKTILGVQFLIEGIKHNETSLYLTFEESRKDFFDNMKSIGLSLEKLEKDEKFFFIEYTPEKVKTMLEEGGGIIESMILRKKIKRIVIDSITSFELLFSNELDKRASTLELLNLLRRWGCTTILTYERDPLAKMKSTSNLLEFESDSIILLYFTRGTQEDRMRYIEVLKMRGTNHSKKIFPLEVKSNGFEVSEEPLTGKIKKN